jgi:hypothetical protein
LAASLKKGKARLLYGKNAGISGALMQKEYHNNYQHNLLL